MDVQRVCIGPLEQRILFVLTVINDISYLLLVLVTFVSR